MKKKEKWLLLCLILLTAAFFRFYRLPDRAVFLGDQGRDLLLVREHLLIHRLPLTGPPTSQKISTGPAYFLLIMPSLWLARYNPLGPIFFFTFLGVLSTLLVFKLGEKFFGATPALITATLYATSGPVIERTLGIWNPVPVPFFILLILLILRQIQAKNKIHWLPLLGFLLGLSVQFHLSVYFVILPMTAWWLYFIRTQKNRRQALKWSISGPLAFLLALAPFLVFQFKNNFVDLRQMLLFFLTSGPTNQLSFTNQFFEFFGQQFQAISLSASLPLNFVLGLVLIALPFCHRARFWPRFLAFWLFVGLIILGFYPQTTHPHYACFIWPLPFLLLGFLVKTLQNYLPKNILLVLAGGFVLLQVNLFFSHLSFTYDFLRTNEASQTIIQAAGNQSFALTLLSPRSPSDAHLRYLLTLKNAPIRSIDDPTAKLLFIVCEGKCPSAQDLATQQLIDTECLPDCPFLNEQKFVDLKNWLFEKRINFSWGAIDTYHPL